MQKAHILQGDIVDGYSVFPSPLNLWILKTNTQKIKLVQLKLIGTHCWKQLANSCVFSLSRGSRKDELLFIIISPVVANVSLNHVLNAVLETKKQMLAIPSG